MYRISRFYVKCPEILTIVFELFQGSIHHRTQFQQQAEVMDFPKFYLFGYDKCLKVLFRCLLKVKTDLGKEIFSFFEVNSAKFQVLISLSEPLHDQRRINHRGLYPLLELP